MVRHVSLASARTAIAYQELKVCLASSAEKPGVVVALQGRALGSCYAHQKQGEKRARALDTVSCPVGPTPTL